MAIPTRFLEELKARISLPEVIGRSVKLVRKGREQAGCCPFHNEKTPSFYVYDDHYHCFGCGAHGSAIDFVMNTENVNFPEAVEKLAAEAGMEVPSDTPEERARAEKRQTLYDAVEAACAWFEKTLRMPEGKVGLDYLRDRGLDDETISRFRLGFAPDTRGACKAALSRDGISEELMVASGLLVQPEDPSRSPYDRFRGRVMFPITDRRGRVIAFGGRIIGDGEPKYLNSPETDLFHKGRTLYALAQALPPARKQGALLVTEGYMDVIALHRAGFDWAVAPLGTALTEDQIQAMWKIVPEPVLCFDGDKAGQRAAGRAAERALPLIRPGQGLRFAVLPEGEDPDSLIAKAGPEAMTKVLGSASSLSDVLWRMESHGRVPSSPEERAALQKRLEDHARQIEDPTVRSHFLRTFKDRIWQRQDRGPARKQTGRAPVSSGALDSRAATASTVEGLTHAERVLTAIVLNHPDFIHHGHVEEEFGTLHFSDPGLEMLRQEMIAVLAEPPPGTESAEEWQMDTLRAELEVRGLAEAVDLLFRDPLIRRHRQIRPDALHDTIKETWEEMLKALRHAAFLSELHESNSEDDFEAEVRRLLALKRAEHGDT